MEKEEAVASLGAAAPIAASLLRPARGRAVLTANERPGVYLSGLQAAPAHTRSPLQPCLDLRQEIAAARIGRGEHEMLEEHGGLVQALAQALRDALAHGAEHDEVGAKRLAARASTWE
jgi:hypothetical protein